MELAASHLYGIRIFQVAPTFSENLCTPALYSLCCTSSVIYLGGNTCQQNLDVEGRALNVYRKKIRLGSRGTIYVTEYDPVEGSLLS
jgi:hypothetical protein